ncbi:NAD-dependent epimerase/dehydratase family protein [Cytobacillus gottheilii]|uniref:NAD-dependent epimerase/dehydratase family protein n=1 Tax=Cytobacillus gottheilii TaxID=859144 RepID=UPI0024956DC1|nr:NAD-dependent epimerase/dehydratase family protein [Cytobacillus gottheilii]
MQKERGFAKSKRETILITGGNGFTGRHACRYFMENDYNVVSVVRSDVGEVQGVQVEICDLTDAKRLNNLIKRIKPEYVLHLAGQSNANESWTAPIHYIDSNVMATLFLLEALREHAPLCKVVITGSILQYPINQSELPPHPYSLSKTLQVFAARSWAQYYDLNIVIAKPTNLIGPGPSTGVCSILAERIAHYEKTGENKILENIDLEAERVFLDVRDAVKAYHQLFISGKTGHEYEVSFGTQASLGKVVGILWSLSHESFEFPETRKSIQRVYVDSDIGCSVSHTLEESLVDTLKYFRNLGNG